LRAARNHGCSACGAHINIASSGLAPLIAVGTQTQIATLFASNGVTVIDPDGAGPLFEVPIAGPLPETLNFIP
jgi:hypothetical protein